MEKRSSIRKKPERMRIEIFIGLKLREVDRAQKQL
jgi:hypothetical protein